jgi:hypothetical protein
MNKQGSELLQENVIFIILNVTFFSVMLLFIYLQSSSVHILEQETAKRIALMIDVAKPGTTIELNLKKLMDKAEKDKVNRNAVIKIDNDNNLIIVRGSKNSYYEYSYFNDIDVTYTFSGDYLVMNIVKKGEGKNAG